MFHRLFIVSQAYSILRKLSNVSQVRHRTMLSYLNLVVAAEAVKLIQQLEHRPLHLPVPRLLPAEPLRSDGVQLVNEYDRPALHDKKKKKMA